MKKIFNSQNLFIYSAAIIFLIQGCCIPPELGISRTDKKKCNCQDDNKAVYALNTTNPSQSDQPLSNSQTFVEEEPSTPTPVSRATTFFLQAGPVIDETTSQESRFDELYAHNQTNRQKNPAKKLPLGIKGITTSLIAAPNISFKSSKEDYGNIDHKHKPGMGFEFGIGTTYMFSSNFAVNTSLIFKQNNASETLSYSLPGEPGGNPINEEYETNYSYNYLSVPLLAEIKLSNQFTAIAGQEISYLLSASMKASGYGNDDKTSITDNSVKMGAGMHLGVKYKIPGSPLAAQVVYEHRFSRLNEKNEYDYPGGGGGNETPGWHMKSIQFGLALSLCDLFNKD